jgi:hypothetical protein
VTTTAATAIRSTDSDGTVTYYGTLVGFDTTVECCGICGKAARKAAIVRESDGFEVRAAGKCARHLLGYDPFKKATRVGGKRA